jgi:hypothetical protein
MTTMWRRKQPFPKRRNAGLSFWVAFGKVHQDADATHALGLLRTHRERP